MTRQLSTAGLLLPSHGYPARRGLSLCAAITLGSVLLAGCATAPVEVRVPVPVPCVSADFPAAPVVRSDADLLAMDDYRLVLALAEERARLAAWTAQAGPVVESCRR